MMVTAKLAICRKKTFLGELNLVFLSLWLILYRILRMNASDRSEKPELFGL